MVIFICHLLLFLPSCFLSHLKSFHLFSSTLPFLLNPSLFFFLLFLIVFLFTPFPPYLYVFPSLSPFPSLLLFLSIFITSSNLFLSSYCSFFPPLIPSLLLLLSFFYALFPLSISSSLLLFSSCISVFYPFFLRCLSFLLHLLSLLILLSIFPSPSSISISVLLFVLLTPFSPFHVLPFVSSLPSPIVL